MEETPQSSNISPKNSKLLLLFIGSITISSLVAGGAIFFLQRSIYQREKESFQKQIIELQEQLQKFCPTEAKNKENDDWNSNGKTYSNKELGFEFRYPVDWNIFTRTDGVGNFTIGFTLDDVVEGVEPINNMIGFVVSVSLYPNSTLSSETTEIVKEYSIGRHEAKKYKYKSIGPGNPECYGVQVDNFKNNQNLSLGGCNEPNFDQIVSSLSFLE